MRHVKRPEAERRHTARPARANARRCGCVLLTAVLSAAYAGRASAQAALPLLTTGDPARGTAGTTHRAGAGRAPDPCGVDPLAASAGGERDVTCAGHDDASQAAPEPSPHSPGLAGAMGVTGGSTRVAGPVLTDVMPAPAVWRDLFGDTVRDLRRLPSKSTLGLLSIGAAAALATHPADQTFTRTLSGARRFQEPLEPGAVLGSTPFQIGASVATYAIARWSGHPHLTAVAGDLVRGQLLAEGLTYSMKQAFRRDRPEGAGFAFPSGHTSTSFASATVLRRHYGWRVGAPAYAIASYVALSRVQMKRHYLSDVAFGAALGIAAGRTVTIGHARELSLGPMFTPGGGGVQIAWQRR
jgi:membrane-associated phospholipid phosphatase